MFTVMHKRQLTANILRVIWHPVSDPSPNGTRIYAALFAESSIARVKNSPLRGHESK